MPVSTIDSGVALVVIDLQEGHRAATLAHPMPDLIARSAELAVAFRAHGLPVVFVTVDGRAPGRTQATRGGSASAGLPEGYADLLPELGRTTSEPVVTKQRWGAFIGTELDAVLRDRGVTQVVLTGVSTTAGVESTARSAYDYGYSVLLAVDAISDRDLDAHTHTVEKIFPRLGETATSREIVAALPSVAPPS